ncbi:GntR family transcriptional regulator [Herbidospora sp. NEAU-GS84]|uniref:GntR family transcriptional regulator n=1 Tax=Herbidospora solisilvae TaxID=2696284 RepID=A0A7C9JZP3_9ACTN|nr:PLP-dependent aminotransferase family protein [Herbidospora solisilvae]NAS25959.1 GntR family transcriptional regulator [Herbidospora solisilvae]
MRFSEPLTFAIQLDKESRTPLHAQLEAQLREAIRSGVLSHGDRVPSTRGLAATLGVSRSVTLQVFNRLFADGILEARQGCGNFVNYAPSATRADGVPARPAAEPTDLRPAGPGSQFFPVKAWRSAWRLASQHVPSPAEALSGGDPRLREALASHLRRQRGLTCSPEQIIVTAGLPAAINLLCQVRTGPGDEVAVEVPDGGRGSAPAPSPGRRIVPLPVDEEGVVVPRFAVNARMAIVRSAPHHPIPALSPRRRRALLDWARRYDVLLVELERDPYGMQLNPCAPLAGPDDHGRVAFVGSLSEAVGPALEIGYIVSPPELVSELIQALRVAGTEPSLVVQRAAFELLSSGQITRHVRRMAGVHGARRRTVRRAFAPVRRHVGDLGFRGFTAVVGFRELSAQAIADRLKGRGVLVGVEDAGPGASRLLLGLGHLDDLTLQRGLHVVIEAVRQTADATRDEARREDADSA